MEITSVMNDSTMRQMPYEVNSAQRATDRVPPGQETAPGQAKKMETPRDVEDPDTRGRIIDLTA